MFFEDLGCVILKALDQSIEPAWMTVINSQFKKAAVNFLRRKSNCAKEKKCGQEKFHLGIVS
jgi:hypothetical protein